MYIDLDNEQYKRNNIKILSRLLLGQYAMQKPMADWTLEVPVNLEQPQEVSF